MFRLLQSCDYCPNIPAVHNLLMYSHLMLMTRNVRFRPKDATKLNLFFIFPSLHSKCILQISKFLCTIPVCILLSLLLTFFHSSGCIQFLGGLSFSIHFYFSLLYFSTKVFRLSPFKFTNNCTYLYLMIIINVILEK